MKRIARLAGLFSILLLAFIGALAVSQGLMQRQTERLRLEAVKQKQAQFLAALDLGGLGPPPWSDTQQNALERSLGARIRIGPPFPNTPHEAVSWGFTHAFPSDGHPTHVRVDFAPPPAARLLDAVQSVAAILFMLALGVIVVFAAFLLWSVRSRETAEDIATVKRDADHAGLRSLQHLASVSARQGDELERERSERLRIEEDLHIKQFLLNRALEQKIRLGQDLHDGIIQSLYATGLALESTRGLIGSDPVVAGERIGAATQALNATIREVRAYINGLAPDALISQPFEQAVAVLTHDLAAGRAVSFEISVDAPAASALTEDMRTDLLQVIREAVSNSLRHGRATRVAVRLESSDGAPALHVSDNGSGLTDTPAARSAGHGLENIRARIRHHGGTVSIESSPGQGTSITCRFSRPSLQHT